VIKELVNRKMTFTETVELLRLGIDVCVVVTPAEDRLITNAGCRNKMPDGWTPGDDRYARYRAAGLDPDNFAPLTEEEHEELELYQELRRLNVLDERGVYIGEDY
jgi:hypothetical protein